MSNLSIRGRFQPLSTGSSSVWVGFPPPFAAYLSMCLAAFLAVYWAGPAAAGELSYQLQSTLVGGNNAALLSAENTRANAVKQAKDRVIAEEARRIRELETAAAATPEARFLSSLQSQIYFAVSQKIATSITGLASGASGTFRTGNNVVTYVNNGKTLTVEITTPLGTSVMELPTTP